MKIIARIGVGRGEADPDLMARLRSAFPGNPMPFGLLAVAPLDDPRVREVLGLLEGAGLAPWDFTTGRELEVGAEYQLNYEREYDADDLAACDFLEVAPPTRAVHLGAAERDGSGRLIVPRRGMPRGFAIMINHIRTGFIATEAARSAIGLAGLRHVEFLPVSYRPTDMDWNAPDGAIEARHGRPFWELDSDFTMPPLSPAMALTDADGNPADRGDFSNGLQAREGLFLRPELRYRRSDLAGLGPFDLARTHEPFGNYQFRGHDRRDCSLIASRRFREVCVEKRLKTGWVPVRVDPG